jgi:aconitate hydratase
MTVDSLGARGALEVGDASYDIFRLDALAGADLARLPYSVKILLENLLRQEAAGRVDAAQVEALARWDPRARAASEVPFSPARVLLQDFTGVPALVDLAAMRDAMAAMGGSPERINPLCPAELVIDHSVVVDSFGRPESFARNAELEFARNRERYAFLRWGQGALSRLRVVPPDTGIVHQVNIEYLARVVFVDEEGTAYPDTLVGTDSHTTMVNGLGVLGWGVGGIEAEAALLGQPVPMLTPEVVGFRLDGELPPGSTATDLVLTVTHELRKHGVVGKLVEFYGPGVSRVPLADRATIGNMSPEYGSTCAIFPIDAETLSYLRLTGRPDHLVALVEAYAKEQGLFHEAGGEEPRYSETLELDLSSVAPSIAGPSRPQDLIPLRSAKDSFSVAIEEFIEGGAGSSEGAPVYGGSAGDDSGPVRARKPVAVELANGERFSLDHGHVVIAAITSCTNTSNPSLMLAAGLVARKARARGLRAKPWVKTSLAPGSQVVMEYYRRAGLVEDLEELGFYLVGFGCTTCIGNSGPLPPEISEAVKRHELSVCSVLSGNRNFEGRINPDCRMNYLASPPLVVAYAIAGTMDLDLTSEPLGIGNDGAPVYLADIWPTPSEVSALVAESVDSSMFRASYGEVFRGDERWRSLEVPTGSTFAWDPSSTYVRRPPYFDGMGTEPPPLSDVRGARVLAFLGDSVTTDHISPAGVIAQDSPAAAYLRASGVETRDFNSYGSRRGNHEVMIRGTFANIRLRNKLVPGVEGGFTRLLPDGGQMTIYEAALRYAESATPLLVVAGKEYGAGSSRDWAAKGVALLGVRAVLAESFERIHRSNLIGMGVLPLQFPEGESAESLGLDGTELYDVTGIEGRDHEIPATVAVRAGGVEFEAVVRIDSPQEAAYFRHGGILQYVLRQLASQDP